MRVFPAINFKAVQWGPTAQVHGIRAFAAGLVWAVILLLNGGSGSPWWAMPLAFPFVYLFGLPIYLSMAKVVAVFAGEEMGKTIVGLLTIVFLVGIVVGDPLVHMLHQKRPDLVPVEKFNIVNFVLVMFVYDPARAVAA